MSLLNWNGKADTLECLASIASISLINNQDFKVIVVDNRSTDDSMEAITNEFPDSHLIMTGENLGFSDGNNVGISSALENNFDYILLLNNDTIIEENLLSAFIKASETTNGPTLFGAKIYLYSQPDTLWFAGGVWHSETLSFEHVGLRQPDRIKYLDYKECDYITDCALFANSDAFRTIGLLNDDFFLTYEETDWCYRAHSNGYKCIVVPSAKLWHKVSASFGGSSSPLITYFIARIKLLWAKNNIVTTTPNIVSMIRKKMLNNIFPPIPSNNKLFSRRTYWNLRVWLKAININIREPHNRAILYGIRDYYFKRYGDSPQHIRLLKNNRLNIGE